MVFGGVEKRETHKLTLYPINGICPIFQTVGAVSNRTINVNLVVFRV